ncbi:uncharacterized protein LOC114737910 [Neltuma alba]|uniref:uncharacterized protein LOC114737910 n=1 Tax=Neltuma alba TaxID=207710 RepID=UPI0010A33420|nr:uncharacterized protein LOC114737910 [Prosopis alba]
MSSQSQQVSGNAPSTQFVRSKADPAWEHCVQPMIDAIAAIGPGYKELSYHAFRTKLLQDMKNEVQLLVDEYRSFWAETGCTIMADGWQDQRNRQLINFLVYCPRGIVFIKSVDASDIVKDAQTLCNLFLEMVTFVGVDNVVHLVTDNAANYKAARRLLTNKHPSMYWSPYAAHCLNLILVDIGKMAIVTSLASRASKVSKFIYNHAFLLAWLRKTEGWKEIIHPRPTRFATTFIALKGLLDHKHDLQALMNGGDILEVVVQMVVNKNKTSNPIDHESIDKIEYWIIEEVDSPPLSTLRADEIEEDIIYDNTTLPMPIGFINEEDNYEERGNEAQVKDGCFGIRVGVGVDLGSFSQEDIDSHSAKAADPDAFLETHAWLNQDPPIFDKSSSHLS